jgi:hypothetical protein
VTLNLSTVIKVWPKIIRLKILTSIPILIVTPYAIIIASLSYDVQVQSELQNTTKAITINENINNSNYLQLLADFLENRLNQYSSDFRIHKQIARGGEREVRQHG